MKAGSPRGAQTKRRIIETAFDLFHLKGVAATSPDEIIAISRTGKGQFYYYFNNKSDLVHQALETHLEFIEVGKAPVKYDIESWEELERWFLDHVELQKAYRMTRSCPFGTIGNGVTAEDELIRLDLCRIFEAVKRKLAAFFTREKAQGRLAADADEERLADYCIAVVQGAMLMGKIKRSSQAAEASLREALAHLKQFVRPSA
jgi:TetR/AcrR family transcriptional regulator, transcriptional repressor for nem operon